MQNNFNFTIDEYEKSTNEFEKYVNTIPKKVPLKLAKMNTVSSLIKDFIQKSEFNDTEELCILTNILNSVQVWSNKKPVESDKLISLALRHDELNRQLREIHGKVNKFNEDIEEMASETNGFYSVSEIDEVAELLKAKNLRTSGKDNEKILIQIQELKDLLPVVRKVEMLMEKVERLQREKEIVVEYIEQSKKMYEQMVKRME